MAGSDWPVCTLAAPYDRVMRLVKDYMQGYREEEREMVLGGNACQVYRLQE